jgi:DNA-binding NarL/FixJ family response regulator
MMVVDEFRRGPVRRVVLVDARDERRELMRHLVEGDDAVAILVGEAGNRTTAFAIVDEHQADSVVLDVQMPIVEGLATIRALRDRYPQLGIVVCSFDLDQATLKRVLAEGADACLAKPVNRRDIHTALAGLRRNKPPVEDLSAPPVTAMLRAAVAAG